MTPDEYDRRAVESAVAELMEDIDVYNSFTSPLLFERAVKAVFDKLPLRLKVEVSNRAVEYFKEKYPQFFDEKGEFRIDGQKGQIRSGK